ncbi:hypothetical protein ABGB18_25060 [Nonomuraea sp. B12E4]|uniref:hypothetical protein n=1 Tax=Nonomuraea sp. B12E4 TaxID=3153564 RepID=UPI00325C520A
MRRRSLAAGMVGAALSGAFGFAGAAAMIAGTLLSRSEPDPAPGPGRAEHQPPPGPGDGGDQQRGQANTCPAPLG